jgi:hypothetical protein
MQVRGYLTTLNQVLGPIQLAEGFNGAVCVQYGSVGNDNLTASSGTIVLQASVNYRVPNTNLVYPATQLQVDWVTLDMKNPATAPPTDILLLSAVGLGVCEVLGYTAIQVVMSVAGGAHGVDVTLNWQIF